MLALSNRHKLLQHFSGDVLNLQRLEVLVCFDLLVDHVLKHVGFIIPDFFDSLSDTGHDGRWYVWTFSVQNWQPHGFLGSCSGNGLREMSPQRLGSVSEPLAPISTRSRFASSSSSPVTLDKVDKLRQFIPFSSIFLRSSLRGRSFRACRQHLSWSVRMTPPSVANAPARAPRNPANPESITAVYPTSLSEWLTNSPLAPANDYQQRSAGGLRDWRPTTVTVSLANIVMQDAKGGNTCTGDRRESEPRCRAVPQHGLASVRWREGARPRHRDLRSVRHVPIPPVRVGRNQRAQVPALGNTQNTPGNGAGFGARKGRKWRAQAPRGCKPLIGRGLQRFVDARRKCDFLRHAAFCSQPHARGVPQVRFMPATRKGSAGPWRWSACCVFSAAKRWISPHFDALSSSERPDQHGSSERLPRPCARRLSRPRASSDSPTDRQSFQVGKFVGKGFGPNEIRCFVSASSELTSALPRYLGRRRGHGRAVAP